MSRDIRQLGKTFMANLGGGLGIMDFLSNPLIQGIIIAGVILLLAILVGPMVLDALGTGANAVGGTQVKLPGIVNR